MSRRRLLLVLLGLAVTAARAQQPTEPDRPASPDSPPVTRFRGLFDIDLPALDPPGTVKLILHPHFGDLHRRDYMRTEVGFRWAINQQFEVSAEASAFFTHGLGGGDDGYGIGELRFGSKYIFQEWLRPDYETSVVLNVELPTGSPPLDMTDGHNHYMPGFIIQHHSPRRPKLTTFAGAGLDLLSASSTPGTFVRNQPQDDSFSVTAGIVYNLGQIRWTLAGTYASTAFIGNRSEHFLYLRPSVLWYVPRKYTFNSKTQWIVGLGLRSNWGPDGYEFGVSNRVRAELTFRQMLANMRQRNKAKDAR